MKCTNCGAELDQAMSFCTNCGAKVGEDAAPAQAQPVDVDAVADAAAADQPAAEAAPELGASLESAVEANQQVVDSVNAHAQIADEAQARWAESEAQAQAQAAAAQAQPQPAAAFQQPAYGQPEAPAGYTPPSNAAAGAAAAGAAAAGAAAAPFYQQDVSPNAHYSSQRTYDQNAYGQNTGQPAYQQPSYGGQPGPAPVQQVWAPQPATTRALCMVLYVSSLIGLIIALVVRDKDDAFVTHHLNNNVVIVIGMLIAAVLSAVGIGVILGIYLLVMAIMGIVSAYNGDMKELPLIGKIHIVK